jgi:hypothetical protein
MRAAKHVLHGVSLAIRFTVQRVANAHDHRASVDQRPLITTQNRLEIKKFHPPKADGRIHHFRYGSLEQDVGIAPEPKRPLIIPHEM